MAEKHAGGSYGRVLFRMETAELRLVGRALLQSRPGLAAYASTSQPGRLEMECPEILWYHFVISDPIAGDSLCTP